MLVRFFVENFLSFSNEVTFSMVSGPSKKLGSHRVCNESLDINVLKNAVIYGANGSGKSNLIKAMKFGRNFIVNGSRAGDSTNITPFKLDAAKQGKSSKFEYEFLLNNKLYSYGIVLNHKFVVQEWLVEVLQSSEKHIFDRKTDENGVVEVSFPNYTFKDSKEKQFLEFVAQGTRPNQPFINEANDRNVEYFKSIYSWFRKGLIFIFPNTINDGIRLAMDMGNGIEEMYSKVLKRFDTGIDCLVKKRVNLDTEFSSMPDVVKTNIASVLTDKGDSVFVQGPDDKCFYMSKDMNSGELVAEKLFSRHKMKGTNDYIEFDIGDESDGTQRIVDFIPPFIRYAKGDVSVFIDEIDRSLHPSITRSFIKLFNSLKASGNSQLIVTTHEASLLDIELLRRDEIWFVEKNADGESTVYSLEEYKPRHDKDIRKGYLKGRYGAIPFLNDLDLGWNGVV